MRDRWNIGLVCYLGTAAYGSLILAGFGNFEPRRFALRLPAVSHNKSKGGVP